MKGKKKFSWLFGFVLVLSLFLSACTGGGGTTSSGKADSGGNSGDTSGQSNDSGGGGLADQQVLHLAATGDIPSLDIHHATDALSFEADYEIRSGLMRLSAEGKPVPDMAASEPKVSKDKTVYTFTIRDNAKWSDGKPVTAQDFVFAWKRDVNPETGGSYAYIFSSANIKNAQEIMDKNSSLYGKVDKLGIKALSDKKLQITLSKPTPYFLSLMTFPPFYPLREDIVKKYGDDYATDPDKMLYNGAFVMTKWDHGQGWTFEKNPKWWNADKVTLQKVDVTVSKDETTRIRLYKTGQLDYASLTAQHVDQMKNDPGFHKGALTATIYYLKLNEQNKALANENIRDAIYNGFDRSGLTQNILKDGSLPAYYFVPKGYITGPNGNDFRAKEPTINKHSLKEAKASWKKGLQQLGVNKLTLTLLTTDGSQSNKEGVYLKAQLEKNLPGLTIKINQQPRGNFFSLRADQKYDLAISDWIPDYRDPMTYLDMYTTGNSDNQSDYSSKKYDQLVDKIHHMGANPEKRWELMHQAEHVLLEDSGIVPLYQTGTSYVMKPYVKNLVDRVVSGLNWTYTKIQQH
ncbi:MAG TPA: peptide ABC transporter substrate-binding protein [Bacillales bacterium]|nr:peptide ABC transporter substrate-binding protein [Bacillales bacterium]